MLSMSRDTREQQTKNSLFSSSQRGSSALLLLRGVYFQGSDGNCVNLQVCLTETEPGSYSCKMSKKKRKKTKQNIPHIYFVDDEIHFKDTYNYLAKQKELIVVVVMPLMEATLPTHGAAIFENVFCNTH